MDWDSKDCLNLIEAFRLQEVLWDSKNPSYFSKNAKHDAWCHLAKEMKRPVEEIKKNILSLQGSYRREKAKVKKSYGTGKGANDIYHSKWFGFDAMHCFLADKDDPMPTINSVNILSETREMCASPYTGTETSTDTNDIFMPEEDALDTSETQTFPQQQQFVSADNEFTCPSTIQQSRGKKRKNLANTDTRIDEAFAILKKSASNMELNQPSPDECTTYGTFIGNKLRNYTPKTKSFVQYYFNNILFEADMGRFDGMNESNQSTSLPTCYGNLPPTTHISSQTSPHIIFQNVQQAQPSTSNAVFNPIFEHTSDGSSLESSYLG